MVSNPDTLRNIIQVKQESIMQQLLRNKLCTPIMNDGEDEIHKLTIIYLPYVKISLGNDTKMGDPFDLRTLLKKIQHLQISSMSKTSNKIEYDQGLHVRHLMHL